MKDPNIIKVIAVVAGLVLAYLGMFALIIRAAMKIISKMLDNIDKRWK